MNSILQGKYLSPDLHQTAVSSYNAYQGTLEYASHLKYKPSSTFNLPPAPIFFERFEVPVCMAPGPNSTQLSRVVVVNWILSRMYIGDDGVMCDEMELASAYMASILFLTNPEQVIRFTTITDDWRYYGYDLSIMAYDDTTVNYLVDNKYQSWVDASGIDFQAALLRSEVQLVYLGIFTLMLAKTVNPTGYNNWFINRVRTFCGSLGIEDQIDILKGAPVPFAFANMKTVGSKISSAFPIRRTCFLIIASLARSGVMSIVTTAATVILSLCQGCELNHIVIIDKYLTRQYPELLQLPLANGVRSALGIAYKFLAQLRTEDAFFCRILFPQDETSVLNRNHFSVIHNMALACASYHETSFTQFYRDQSPAAAKAYETTYAYLSARNNLIPLSLADKVGDRMGPEERKHYLEDVNRRLRESEDSGTAVFITPGW